MKKHILFLIAFCLTIGLTFAQKPLDLKVPLKLDPSVRTGKLSNGMTYFIRKNTKPEKRAELRLAVNAGSMEENDDQQGLAHFCEHMCFNGTKNFKKSELVDYLESIGTKFGPHLNAYTSFDETVYMLQLPTDKEDVLIKGFQILEDWAHNVSFENDEIDKERGVVTEEWRLGKGANERMRNKYFPILFKDSRYATRLPIGKPEILKNCKYETLKQFYNDWYRPDLMAIIAVGDFDVDKVEKLIKEKFSSIPAKQNPRKLESYSLPDHKEMLIAKATDKEAAYTMVQVMYKHPARKIITIEDYRTSLIENLYTGMLNERYEEIRQQANTPFSFAGCYYGDVVRTKEAYTTYAYLSSDKNIEAGLKIIAEENERASRFGFTATEFERQKKNVLKQNETSYLERDKTESSRLIGEYVYYFLSGSPATGMEFEYNITKKLLEGITLDEVNKEGKKFKTPNNENSVVVITAPEKEGVELPGDEKIKAIFSEVGKSNIKAYVDNVISKPLMAKEPVAGKITEEKQIKELDITELKLSNGVKVFLKATDFKNDEILFSAASFGGTSLCSDQDAISGGFGGYVIGQSGVGEFDKISLQKSLSGKNVSVFPYISTTTENMQGESSPDDLETLMQLIHLYFTQPRKDTTAFASLIQQQMGFMQNRAASPEAAFQDTIQVTMAQYHYRARPFTPEMLKEINLDKAYSIYKDRFSDAGDFMFCFVGSFDMNKMKPLLEKYIASLPATNRKETWKDNGFKKPKGIVQKTVKRGSEPKGSVNIRFYGAVEYNMKNRIATQMLCQLLSIKLREVLREEKGGTYGVQVYPIVEKYPKETYVININFGCGPEKLEELTKATMDVIDNVKKNGCSDKDLTKLKETSRVEREVNLKENRYWLQAIGIKYSAGEDFLELNEYPKIVEGLKSEDLKNAANQYLNTNEFATFKLFPEK
jgi:zinc protease